MTDLAGQVWKRTEELFHQALLLPEDQRAAFLEVASAEDTSAGAESLVAGVRALLAADADAEPLVESFVARAFELAAQGEDEAADPAAPERVGAYRVLEEIGRGGLATVYLAERDDEHFRKRVAVKVLRRGLDTDDVLQRFRHERQILARFEHPNIARLLDGGSTEDGRPFFVMEHVDGEPIDAHCARRGLDLRQRIELFRTVCEAVSYAHQSLVVHRDLKPGNILVTNGMVTEEGSEKGRVKLLDFGIAKLLDPEELAVTQLLTRTGVILLTPAYASPEQMRGETLTTQTDVYSLGVILFRLLTGAAPTLQEPHRQGPRRLLASSGPPGFPGSSGPPLLKPSAAVTEESRAQSGLPQSLGRLQRSLRGDLDTIVLKALRRDPRRRYASVGFLSEDLRRYLAGEQVLARPESLGYRFSKWVRRHRAIAVVVAVTVSLLVAVVAFYALQLRRERDAARWEAERAERVSSLLVGMLEVSDPSRARGETITVRELLAPAAQRLQTELAGQPEMRATLEELIGSIYGNLGLYQEGAPLLEDALELRRRLHEAPHAKVAEALDRLGELSYQRGDYERAEEVLREALEQRLGSLVPEHPSVGKSLNDLAALAQVRGRLEEAEELYRRALANLKAGAGGEDPQTLVTQANLATVLYRQRRLEEAEELCRRTLAAQTAVLGADHPDVAVTENTLAAVLMDARHFDEAEVLFRRGFERQKALYGEEHLKVAISLTNLGTVLYRRGRFEETEGRERFEEAEGLYRRALELQEKVLGSEHRLVLDTVMHLADLESFGKGNRAAAAGWLRRGVELQRTLLGPVHLSLAESLLRLGRMERRLGRPEEARRHLEELRQIHRRHPPEAVPPWQRQRAAALEEALAQ